MKEEEKDDQDFALGHLGILKKVLKIFGLIELIKGKGK